MAPLFKLLSLAATLAAFTSAAPMVNKRDYITDTVTEWVTVDTTTTVYGYGPTQVLPEVSSSSSSSPSAPQVTQGQQSYPSPPATTSPAVWSPSTSWTTPLPAVTAPPLTTASTTSSSSTSTSTVMSTATAVSNSAAGGSSGSYGGSCSSSSPCTGQGTYYDTATSYSSPSFCDTTNDGMSQQVVALSHEIMTSDLCGKTISISYGGTTTTAIVVDKCMGCSKYSIDMSRKLFGALASLSVGRLDGVEWYYD